MNAAPSVRLLLMAVALLLVSLPASLGCATTSYVVRGELADAPVDREVAELPGARGFWFPSREYGQKVYVLVAGRDAANPRAETLVMVHGLGDAGVRDFYPLLPGLTRDRRVVTFDLPGFGRSEKGNLKYAPDRFARVVSEVIGAFAEGKVDVLGHSMGGAISLLHSASYPEQVRRLVVVDAAGILHREAWVAEHTRRVTGPTSGPLPRVAEAMSDAASMVVDASRVFGAAPDLILELGFLRQKVLKGEPGRISALSLILFDFGPALARIEAPTLIAWGAKDTIAPVRTGQLLADRVRDTRLVVIPDAGHVPMRDTPAVLLAEIARHLGGPPREVIAALPSTSLPASSTVLVASAPGAAGVGAPPPKPSPPASGRCKDARNVTFDGVYDVLEIEDCAGVRVEGARARQLILRRSSVSVVRSRFSEGIVAEASSLIMTGGGADGPVAIDAKDSQLDLAGVAIETSGQVCRLTGDTRVVFSVCPVRTPKGLAYRHGFEKSGK